MSQYVVIGTSPFNDTSVAVGPFRNPDIANTANEDLESLGWNAEVCQLMSVGEVGPVNNDE